MILLSQWLLRTLILANSLPNLKLLISPDPGHNWGLFIVILSDIYMADKAEHLIWIDLEMTGLNVETDVILEIATLVTDPMLNIVAKGPNLAIWQSDETLAQMDEWNTSHHNASGLVARVKSSPLRVADAEAETLAFLRQHMAAGDSPMCGNSIHTDRRYLERYMPALAQFFHYRNLDVSTVKELCKRWAPEVYQKNEKDSKHLAMEDILDSINELKYYREHFFRLPSVS